MCIQQLPNQGHVRFNEKCGQLLCSNHLFRYDQRNVVVGLSGQALDLFSGFRSIMAGASGTIMHLDWSNCYWFNYYATFAGAKIIRLNLSNSEDKAMYQGVQKLLVLIMIPIEAIPQTYGFLDPMEFS